MKYRLVAIDLDGTLLGPDQRVREADAEAIAAACDAGTIVVPCTGRGWRESAPYLQRVGGFEQGVFNSGAIVARMADGGTMNAAGIDADLASQLVDHLSAMPEAVMVYQDANRSGTDYLISGPGPLTDEMQQWFANNDLRVRRVIDPTPDDLRHTLRISLVAIGEHGFDLEKDLAARFGKRIERHCFAGVPGADRSKARFMVEVFAAGVDKWRGVKWLAGQRGIADHEIAAIGDEINDLALLKQAGLGVAMGNASPPAKAAADRLTLSYEAHGVAHALHQMLEGNW
jgi:hydroxymethylpyrimidine pyrophosphatase-like HAD family hydrolase